MQLDIPSPSPSSQPSYVRKPFLRLRDIVGPNGVLPISRSTFYAWVAAGRIPAGTKLSHGVTVWPADLIIGFAKGQQA